MRKAKVSSTLSGTNFMPTKPIPEDIRARPIKLTDNARVVLQKRYVRRGEDGKPAETEQEMFWRVAYHVALAEAEFDEDVEKQARIYYDLLTNLEFFPNSPTFTGAGTPLGQLAACFVLAIDDDMGRSESGIFQTLRDAALIQQTGGGNGFAFSRLRPKGAIVKSSRGEATGPVGFLRVYDQAFGEIAQGGSRRGANMAVLKVSHPDIRDFVTSKSNESQITNFNISVGMTDEFMRAVEADEDFQLVNPVDGNVWETVRARDLFDLIVQQAHHNGEPGVLFLDAANRANPVPHLYELESTNPCFIGSTRIATDQGLIPIQDLAENGIDFMVATDNRAPLGGVGTVKRNSRGVAFRQSSPAWKTRENTPVMKLVTQHGNTVIATPDHRFLTPDKGYVELRDLKIGDALLLQAGEGAWSKNYQLPNVKVIETALGTMASGGDHASGHVTLRRDFAELYANTPTQWSHELGMVMGWLVGDGWLSPTSASPLGMVFGTEKDDAQEIIHSALQSWFGEGHLHNRGSVQQLTYGRLPYRFFSTLGVKAAKAHEKRVPDSIWTAPREAVVGFLQGLFTADGTVNYVPAKKSCSVRLASSSKGLLEDVQLLLINFGIATKVHHRRASGMRMMPDGKGQQKAYYAHDDYELLIDKANRDVFLDKIGFLSASKQNRAQEFLDSKSRKSNAETFETKVVSLEDAGTADVYDLTEPHTSSLIANGLVTHNCGEQFLGPFENCCLGSINLAKLNVINGKPDWDHFQRMIETSTRFLDDVVTANSYVPAVPQLAQAAHRVRRIGLGVMGLGDLMYKIGVRYGSEEGQEFAGQISEFLRYHAMKTSIDLAKERGAFPAIEGSLYDPENLKWEPPTPLKPYTRDWDRPSLDWDKIVSRIKKHGIRNGAQCTVAPTGTIATVSGCEAYGCEPVFALAYIRHVNDKGQDLQLQYTSPLLQKALEKADLDDTQIKHIIEKVNLEGTCQNIAELPESIRHTFVVSSDITAEEHIYMQAAMQRFIDNAISKCVTGDTLILTPSGLVPIEELSEMRLPDQFEDMAIDVITPYGVEKTEAFFYGGKRETRKVSLSYGYEVEGTPNHRIQVLGENGEIRFTTLNDLKIGDTAVLYAGQQVFGEAAQALPTNTQVINPISSHVNIPARMSTELAYMLGCITSEGTFNPNSISVTNGDRDLLDRLGKLFQKVFEIDHYHITKDMRRESVYSLQINSRVLVRWMLNDLGLYHGARNKTIPSCILRGSRHEIAAFLRGLMLDGYMTADGRMFGIGLANRKMLRQLQTLFLNFGIVSRLHKAGPHAWAVTVSGSMLEKLAAFVEFDEVWKNERIAHRHEGRQQRLHTYAELMPRTLTAALRTMQEQSKNSLRGLYGEQTKEYQRARVNLLQNHRVDRDLAKRIYQHFGDVSNAYADTFFASDQPTCVYVEVEAIQSGFAEVYDLSVPGSHTFVANGLGNHNTCNFPAGATVEDVKQAYILGWKLGCKGLTVYVTGSRDKVVLETHATAKAKEGKQEEAPTTAIEAVPEIAVTAAQLTVESKHDVVPNAQRMYPTENNKRERPRRLVGQTFRVGTPLGATYITVNENGDGKGQPFEVFIHTAKAGSETAAISEAIGRLISLVLRMKSPLEPRLRLKEIIDQLDGIGGGRATGFGPARVRSLPDGVAQALQEYVEVSEDVDTFDAPVPVLFDPPTAHTHGNGNGNGVSVSSTTTSASATIAEVKKAVKAGVIVGDLCPECGEASVVNEEGCRKCYSCGYSEC